MSHNRKWLAAMALVLIALAFVLYEFLSASLQNVRLIRSMETEPGNPPDRHVILISQEQNTPYWLALEEGAAEAAERLGMGIEYWAPYRLNTDEQRKLLAKAIAAKPDALLVQGIVSEEYDSLIDRAERQGIAVVTIDSDSPESGRLAYVGTDNLAAGRQIGELAVRAGAPKGSVGVIVGSLQADNQRLRVQGLREAIEAVEGFSVAAVGQSDISRIEAARQTAEMLAAHPEIRIMVGLSSLDAVGIVEGLKVARRTDIRVFGIDDLGATREAIAAGDIAATVVQHPAEIGREAIELLNRYFNGESVPRILYTSTNVLDAESLNRERKAETQ